MTEKYSESIQKGFQGYEFIKSDLELLIVCIRSCAILLDRHFQQFGFFICNPANDAWF
jgi:hypothetical protein